MAAVDFKPSRAEAVQLKLRDGSGTLHDVDDSQTQEVEKGWMANFACSDAFGIVGDSTMEKHLETDFNR